MLWIIAAKKLTSVCRTVIATLTHYRMSLTKHLYRFDEVRAAFLYTLAHKRPSEAQFWLNELEDSYYSGEARRLLLISWMMRSGLRNLSWLEAWAVHGNTRAGRQLLCWQLDRWSARDSSIWWLLWAQVLMDSSSDCKLLSAWGSSLQKNDTLFWTDLLADSDDPRIDTILEALQEDMKAYGIFAKAIGVAVVYSYKKVSASAWSGLSTELPQTIFESIEGWRVYDGNIRKGRVYSIPYDCLFGMTRRGLGEDTTEEIRRLTMTSLETSPFWKKCMVGVDTETFWDTHFNAVTCDHPDEWSLAEQQCSHGEGATGGFQAPFARWWSAWTIQERLFIYGRPEAAVSAWVAKEKIGNYASVLDRLLGLYKECVDVKGKSKKAIKKEFITV
jgi:hypothetical protein